MFWVSFFVYVTEVEALLDFINPVGSHPFACQIERCLVFPMLWRPLQKRLRFNLYIRLLGAIFFKRLWLMSSLTGLSLFSYIFGQFKWWGWNIMVSIDIIGEIRKVIVRFQHVSKPAKGQRQVLTTALNAFCWHGNALKSRCYSLIK